MKISMDEYKNVSLISSNIKTLRIFRVGNPINVQTTPCTFGSFPSTMSIS